jgi:hypothetical protein
MRNVSKKLLNLNKNSKTRKSQRKNYFLPRLRKIKSKRVKRRRMKIPITLVLKAKTHKSINNPMKKRKVATNKTSCNTTSK